MKKIITVLTLGFGDPELLNSKTIRYLRESAHLILRTENHPIVSWLREQKIPFEALDSLYDQADSFDDLNRLITAALQREAEKGPVTYAVTDACTDFTVQNLFDLHDPQLEIVKIPGTGLFDQYHALFDGGLCDSVQDTVPASVLLSAGYFDPAHSLLITEIDNEVQAGEVKLLLGSCFEDEQEIVLFSREHSPAVIPLYLLDRQKQYDQFTAVLVQASSFHQRRKYVFSDLLDIMETLRSFRGCPWDRKQTHESLRTYLIEEAWECVAAIDERDMDHLAEELGDLLFQIVFHASIGQSFDEFSINDVITSICEKMIRRHPHVFAKEGNSDRPVPEISWEQLKRTETGHFDLLKSLNDVSAGLPALKYAEKIIQKLLGPEMRNVRNEDVCKAIREELLLLQENRNSDADAGRLLFYCTLLFLSSGEDSELILHRTVDRLKKVLSHSEDLLQKDGKFPECLTFQQLCVYLNHVEGEIE